MKNLVLLSLFLLFAINLGAIEPKKWKLENIRGEWFGENGEHYYIKQSKKNKNIYRVLDLQNLEGIKLRIRNTKDYFHWNGHKAEKSTITKDKIIWTPSGKTKNTPWFRTNPIVARDKKEFGWSVANGALLGPFGLVGGGVGLAAEKAVDGVKGIKKMIKGKTSRTMENILGIWYNSKGDEFFVTNRKKNKKTFKVVDLGNIEGEHKSITEEKDYFAWSDQEAIKFDYPNELTWKLKNGKKNQTTTWTRKPHGLSNITKGYLTGGAVSTAALAGAGYTAWQYLLPQHKENLTAIYKAEDTEDRVEAMGKFVEESKNGLFKEKKNYEE